MLNATLYDELRRAYDLLDAPHSAPPDDIKRAYRRITKRWHPDRYRSGTPAHAEATQVMKQINRAYSLIADAPLLHLTAPSSSTPNQNCQSWNATSDPNDESLANLSPKFGRRIDFVTRFIFGAFFGFVVGFRGFARNWSPEHTTLSVLLYLAVVLACGFGAARWGDRFWTS